MRALLDVTPTREQLRLITNAAAGVMLIRGAAGSGKTTTCLLRLKQLVASWRARRKREKLTAPVRTLVLTFNRTLCGYIDHLTESQVQPGDDLELTVSTFARWAQTLGDSLAVSPEETRDKIIDLASGLQYSQEFILDETDHVLGRFLPETLDDYLAVTRTGRGPAPRVDRQAREQLLTTVVRPYMDWKRRKNLYDWNDLALRALHNHTSDKYDLIIADESQDLSANQVRAISHMAAPVSSLTFVLDAAQRLYPRGYTWSETGLTIRPEDTYRLSENHRNTSEICRFVLPLLDGLDLSDDGTLPNLKSCTRSGPKPVIVTGLYSQQISFALKQLVPAANKGESVAFLHPKGSFKFLANVLRSQKLAFVEITREAQWPTGPENIALSTLHSAKGLEFDHVAVLGLNPFAMPAERRTGESLLDANRRLLAMGLLRARNSVIVGYKPEEAADIVSYFEDDTYDEAAL